LISIAVNFITHRTFRCRQLNCTLAAPALLLDLLAVSELDWGLICVP
jgi:hypothetical protein